MQSHHEGKYFYVLAQPKVTLTVRELFFAVGGREVSSSIFAHIYVYTLAESE